MARATGSAEGVGNVVRGKRISLGKRDQSAEMVKIDLKLLMGNVIPKNQSSVDEAKKQVGCH